MISWRGLMTAGAWLLVLTAGLPIARAEVPEDLLGVEGFGTLGAEEGDLKVTAQIVRQPGDGSALLQIKVDVSKGWHTFSTTQPKGGPMKTKIVLDPPAKLAGPMIPNRPPHLTTEDVYPGVQIEQYEGTVYWIAPLDLQGEAIDKAKVTGKLSGQICREGACMPIGEKFTAAFDPQAVPVKITAPAEAPPAVEPEKPAKASMPLHWVIVAAFVGGFILNLMPCVLPVIGLKILSFAEQAGQSRMQVLALNLWYSLGVLVVFWILAGMAVFLNLAWGEQFQAIWFNVLMTGVVFAMGLSFLGVWEIPVPGFATTDKASDLADSEGALGAFFKGMLTTVLSTPCSGPLLGAVFSYLVTQEPYVSFLVFTCIGLGMASPYLLVGLEPSLIRFIPRPGEWMNTFKHVMGFVMMGAAVLLFASVAKDYRIATLTFLVGLSASCWLIGKIPVGSEWPETIQGWSYATALSIVIGLVSFGFLGPNEFELPWQEWRPGQAETLAKSGKTVLVDFTADWCQTCKFNLKWAINTQAVKEAVEQKGVVPLIADWTTESEEIKAALLSLDNSRSIPLLAIYPAGKPEEVIILRDLVTQGAVLEALEKAGPSQTREASAVALSEGARTE